MRESNRILNSNDKHPVDIETQDSPLFLHNNGLSNLSRLTLSRTYHYGNKCMRRCANPTQFHCVTPISVRGDQGVHRSNARLNLLLCFLRSCVSISCYISQVLLKICLIHNESLFFGTAYQNYILHCTKLCSWQNAGKMLGAKLHKNLPKESAIILLLLLCWCCTTLTGMTDQSLIRNGKSD